MKKTAIILFLFSMCGCAEEKISDAAHVYFTSEDKAADLKVEAFNYYVEYVNKVDIRMAILAKEKLIQSKESLKEKYKSYKEQVGRNEASDNNLLQNCSIENQYEVHLASIDNLYRLIELPSREGTEEFLNFEENRVKFVVGCKKIHADMLLKEKI